jgi:hypothetical protein
MKSIPLACALLLGWTVSAPGQTTFSLSGGLNVARTSPGQPSFSQGSTTTTSGFAVQASVGFPYRNRFAWRIDLFASRFDLTQLSDYAGVMCQRNPPPGTCCGICPLRTEQGPVGVMGLALNQVVRVTPATSSLGMYLIWGAETDYLYEHPFARGAVRLGASVGGGVRVPLAGHVRAFVEGRYHHLFDGPSAPTWVMPVTFGLQM